MQIKTNHIIILILVIIIFLLAKCNSDKIENLKSEVNIGILKNDTLKKDKDGVYRKYVADSVTKRELRKKVKDLEIKSKTPVIVEKIIFKYKTIQKTPDTIYVKEDSINIVDYYPNKGNSILKYSLTKSRDKQDAVSMFEFKDVEVGIVIDETKDGLFETKIKAPDFIKIGSVDVHMLPKTTKRLKKDNFGVLMGGGIGQNYKDNSKYLKLSAGTRFKKTYLHLQATTNQSLDLTLLYEF